MSDSLQLPDPEANGAQPTASQIAFQNQTNAIAHHLLGLLASSGAPPVMAVVACAQIVKAIIIDMQKSNPDIAKMLLEDFAADIVTLCAPPEVTQ